MSFAFIQDSAWRVYWRLLGFAKPYRLLLLIAVLGLFIEAGAGSAFLALMSPVTNNLVNPEDINVWMPLAIIGLFLIRGIAGYLTSIGMGKAARSIARDLRVKVLAKYLRMPGAHFDSEPVSSMLVRLGSDSDQVAQTAVDALKVVLQQSLQIIGALAVMLWYSWQVTVSILVLAPPLGWVMDKVAKRYRHISHLIQESGAGLLQAAELTLSNQQAVKVYGGQGSELNRYTQLANTNLHLAMKVEVTRSLSTAMVQLIGAIGLAALLFIAGHEAAAGRLSVGDFVGLMLAMMVIIPALKQLTSVQNMTQRGIASAQRLFAVLDADDEVDKGQLNVQRAQGLLEFRNVCARYPQQDNCVLNDVSFIAKPGTVTAIVGRSGGGKSTLIKLIPRFYEIESGQILLDGQPLHSWRLTDLRRQIALVSQQVALFDGSIADNVAYGELGNSDPEKLQHAITSANAREFIQPLPQGLDSPIGPRGSLLSGGQRQRLAIARAILKDAPILLLDEATAALDNESERLVQDALQRLMPDRTTLVIAHRLSTIEHADQVLVLDQGRIVESGTHAQLLALGGLYERLYRMQFRDEAD